MSDFTLKLTKPFGPPLGITIMPKKIIEKVNHFIDNEVLKNENKSKELDHGSQLAGQVKQEIYLPPEIVHGDLLKFLSVLSNSYVKNSIGKEITKFNLISVWVVRQFENEYNPIHYHSGHISGAGFLKVPSSLGSHKQESKSGQMGYLGGNLQLIHGSRMFLSPSTINIKPKEGEMYFFPAYLRRNLLM